MNFDMLLHSNVSWYNTGRIKRTQLRFMNTSWLSLWRQWDLILLNIIIRLYLLDHMAAFRWRKNDSKLAVWKYGTLIHEVFIRSQCIYVLIKYKCESDCRPWMLAAYSCYRKKKRMRLVNFQNVIQKDFQMHNLLLCWLLLNW